jgi:hypothetical protein
MVCLENVFDDAHDLEEDVPEGMVGFLNDFLVCHLRAQTLAASSASECFTASRCMGGEWPVA